MGDAAEGGGADVDVGLWLDLAGAADDGREILLVDLGSEHLGVARLLLVDEDCNQDDGNNDCSGDQEDLFHVSLGLRESPLNSTQSVPARFPSTKNSHSIVNSGREAYPARLQAPDKRPPLLTPQRDQGGVDGRIAGRLRSLK